MMRSFFRALPFLLALLLMAGGCDQPPSEGGASRPAATESPTRSLGQVTVTAEGAGLRLSLPETITAGGELNVRAVNDRQTPYVLYPVDGDNCLQVVDAAGRPQQLTFPETCDVLMEVIVRPGEAVYIGSWDLQVCATPDCLQREAAPAGLYTVAATFYPYAEGESVEAGTGIKVTAEVRVGE